MSQDVVMVTTIVPVFLFPPLCVIFLHLSPVPSAQLTEEGMMGSVTTGPADCKVNLLKNFKS